MQQDQYVEKLRAIESENADLLHGQAQSQAKMAAITAAARERENEMMALKAEIDDAQVELEEMAGSLCSHCTRPLTARRL